MSAAPMLKGTALTAYGALVISLGGLLYGYDIGIVSGLLHTLRQEFELSTAQLSAFVAVLFAGSILGCVIGGLIVDAAGRKASIHVQNAFFLFGSIVLSNATTYSQLMVGRFSVGIGISISTIAEVPYLLELAQPHLRGSLASSYEILVTLGVLIAYVVTYILRDASNNWRMSFGLPAIVTLLQSLALVPLPESPYWLLKRGKEDDARRSFERIYHGRDVSIADLISSNKQEATTSSSSNSYGSDGRNRESGGAATIASALRALCRGDDELARFSYPFLVILMLQLLSQLSGGTTVRVYAPTIFYDAGVSTSQALLFNVILGTIKLATNIVMLLFVDRTEAERGGRKKLLLIGNYMIGLGYVILAIGFAAATTTPTSTFLVGCMFILSGYSVSWGPILYLLSSEMFPVVIRGRAVSFSLLINNLAQLLVASTFLPVVAAVGASMTFFLFFLACCASYIYIKFFLVETANKDSKTILRELLGVRDKVLFSLFPQYDRVGGSEDECGERELKRRGNHVAVSVTLGSFYNDYTSTANDAWDDAVDDVVEISCNPIIRREEPPAGRMQGEERRHV